MLKNACDAGYSVLEGRNLPVTCPIFTFFHRLLGGFLARNLVASQSSPSSSSRGECLGVR
jgi:hypothetical protein